MNTQQQKIEELQKLLSEMKLDSGDVVLVKVKGVVAMAGSGSVAEIAGNALIPMLNFLDDTVKYHKEAAELAVKLMVIQLVGGLSAALEHNGVSSEECAKAIFDVLTFPTDNPTLLAASISTAEDFMYKLPRDVKANIHTTISEETILDKIRKHLA